jgi:hypothetical protein
MFEIDGKRAFDLVAQILGRNSQEAVLHSNQDPLQSIIRCVRQALELIEAAADKGLIPC